MLLQIVKIGIFKPVKDIQYKIGDFRECGLDHLLSVNVKFGKVFNKCFAK